MQYYYSTVLIGHQKSRKLALQCCLQDRPITQSVLNDDITQVCFNSFSMNQPLLLTVSCVGCNVKVQALDRSVKTIVLVYNPQIIQTYQYLKTAGLQILKLTKQKNKHIINTPLIIFANCNKSCKNIKGQVQQTQILKSQIKKQLKWNQLKIDDLALKLSKNLTQDQKGQIKETINKDYTKQSKLLKKKQSQSRQSVSTEQIGRLPKQSQFRQSVLREQEDSQPKLTQNNLRPNHKKIDVVSKDTIKVNVINISHNSIIQKKYPFCCR